MGERGWGVRARRKSATLHISMRRQVLLLLALAAFLPHAASGAAAGWPTLREQMQADGVTPRSALEALIAANQDFSRLRPEEAKDKIPVPLWLREIGRAHV